MWDILNNGMFIPTFSFNDEVVNKPNFERTEGNLRKFKLGLTVKHLLKNSLSSKVFYYIFTCESVEEVWETLEMIYGFSPSIKPGGMNTQTQKVEISNAFEMYLHKWWSTIGNLGGYVRNFLYNKYLRVTNWNEKLDLILKLGDKSVYDF